MPRHIVGSLAALTCAVLFSTPAHTAPGTASGQVAVQGGKLGTTAISPTQAIAFASRSERDARQAVVEIVLSDVALDAAAAAQALAPHTQVINQEPLKDRNYVLLWVGPDGRVSMNATFGATMTQFLDATGDTLRAELTVNTRDRVEGRLFTPAPVKTMGGETYSVDLRFAVDVTRLPPGTPVAKGGGAPGKALSVLLAAAGKKNWPAIKAASSPAALKVFEASYRTADENAEMAFDMLQAWLPKKGLVVTGGEERGDVADLEVEGEMFPGTKALYVARMVRVDGGWLFETATIVGMLR